MLRYKLLIAISIITLLLLTSVIVILNAPTPVTAHKQIDFNKIFRDPMLKLDPEISELLNKPSSSSKYVSIIAAVDPKGNFSKIVKGRLTPRLPGGFSIFLARAKVSDILKLVKLPSVGPILMDKRLNYDEFKEIMRSEEFETFKGESEPNLYFIRDMLGVGKVEEEFGIDGSGVTVAVVDSGVDYAHPDLIDALARNENGYPLTFDPDGNGLADTSTILSPLRVNNRTVLLTSNCTLPWIYAFWGPYIGWGGNFTPAYDIDITLIDGEIANKNYHVGVLIEYLPTLNIQNWTDFNLYLPEDFPGVVFNVVVADKDGDGTYETLYLDLSTTWDILIREGLINGPVSGRPLFTIEPDEEFYLGNTLNRPIGGEIIAADYTGDGVPDFSAGSIVGYFIDAINQLGLYSLGVLPGIDPNGNFIDILYDWVPHGTRVAASIAGRGKLEHYPVGKLPGIAKGAKIIAVQALSWGNVFDGWMWASGFDLFPHPEYGFVWNYTGNHKADINSNSWGISLEAYDGFAHGYDFFSLMENFLVAFTNITFVHALGNGGYGYGTITSTGASSFAIGVGASTSFHYMPIFGIAPGEYDQVVSWSARGPTTVGYVKPDVVNVGAFGLTPTTLWDPFFGPGNGTWAWNFFGGTSFATPLTSGVVALIIHAWRQVYGTSPTPDIVKRLLMSTANDLGFDPFLQGSGRPDAYSAVSAIFGKEHIVLASSPTSWSEIGKEVWWAASWYGWPLPSATLLPVSVYFGTVDINGEASASILLENLSPVEQEVTLAPYEWRRDYRNDVTFTYTVSNVSSYWITPLEVPELTILRDLGPRLWRIFVQFSYDVHDVERDYKADRFFIIDLYDWIDLNNNTVIEPNELRRINYSALEGTTQSFFVYTREGTFGGYPVLRVRQYPLQARSLVSVQLIIRLTPFKRISALAKVRVTPPRLNIAPNSVAIVNLTLKPRKSDGYGVFEGIIEISNNYGQKFVLPYSYAVAPIIELTTDKLFLEGSKILDALAERYPYANMRMFGAFDWGWRYEAGDWRMFKLNVRDSNLLSLIVDAKWPRGEMTDINLHGFIAGSLADQSEVFYVGGGVFIKSTRTGVNRDFIVISPTLSLTKSGFTYAAYASLEGPIYTIRLHNVLLDVDAPIWYDLKIGTLRLTDGVPQPFIQAPWFNSPTWWVVNATPGSTITATFAIKTGVALEGIAFLPAPWDDILPIFTPQSISSVKEGGEVSVTLTITIPENIAPGTYRGDFIVLAANYPGTTIALIMIDINIA